MRRWARIGRRSEAAAVAVAWAEQDHQPERWRAAAEHAAAAGDFWSASRCYAELQQCGLTNSELGAWVEALTEVGACTLAAHIMGVAERRDLSPPERERAARAWWRLHELLPEGRERASAALKAWDAMLRRVEDGPADVSSATALVRELHLWRDTSRRVMSEALGGRYRAAMQRLAGTGPEAELLSASSMVDEDAAWALGVLERLEPTREVLHSRLQAHWTTHRFAEAARDCDLLGTLRGAPADDFTRYQWIRSLIEVGRLEEAEHECGRVLVELERLEEQVTRSPTSAPADAAEAGSPASGTALDPDVRRASEGLANADAVRDVSRPPDVPAPEPGAQWLNIRRLRAFYAVDYGRILHARGRYDEAWPAFRRAVELDDQRLDATTRAGMAQAKLVMSRDLQTAARQLIELETHWSAESAVYGGQLDTTMMEACLWVAARWQLADGSWSAHALAQLEPEEAAVLRQARERGLTLAREALARDSRELHAAQRVRVALLVGDELQAREMAGGLSGAAARRWEIRVLHSIVHLQLGEDHEALQLLRSVMAERRCDVELRVLYAHAAMLAGAIEEAAQESLEIVEMVPHHILARAVRAECAFELALRGDGVPQASSGEDDDAVASPAALPDEASRMENVQELIAAVGDYHQAVCLDRRTKQFFEGEGAQAPLGSDVLTPRQVAQICRRGLHAAILAQEGLDRLGLTRDRTLERRASDLVRRLRADEGNGCRGCHEGGGGRFHVVRHIRDHDEATRLSRLMTGYRWGRRKRQVGMVGLLVAGVTVTLLVLTGWWGVVGSIPGPEAAVTAVEVALFTLGLVLLFLPFARSVKLGNFELQRQDHAPPLSGRSKALRSSSVLQRNAMLSGTASVLPNLNPDG